ncbi:2-(1,2-epoxy-1,2-dihydrophenyl)acetyl-CoA isomerase [Archaeoglobales archaeon]|nr:MAG: 2-(1,2-epoxy-1,2-dihydrophenyl)acetyl-CoA isomerase [Archaeoglobales archaeon]
MEFLKFEKEGKVARISFNRPEVHNALNMGLIEELSQALDECEKDDDIKVILLRGEGKSFCSGADLKQFLEFISGTGNAMEYGLKIHLSVLKKMRGLSKPIVAEVKGYSIGAGLGILLATDYAVAAKSSIFSCGFILVGLSPDSGTSFFIPRSVSFKRAFELMSTGRRFSAEEALEYGFVTEVVDDEMLEERVAEVINLYLNRPRTAIANLKKLLNASHSNSLDEHLSFELTLAMLSTLSKDFAEGVRAGLEKREPVFD